MIGDGVTEKPCSKCWVLWTRVFEALAAIPFPLERACSHACAAAPSAMSHADRAGRTGGPSAQATEQATMDDEKLQPRLNHA